MMDRRLLSDVGTIAELSAKAAEADASEATLADAYEALRTRAITTARAHGLASSQELADQFPTVQGLREIERLDLEFRDESVANARGMSVRLSRALIELSAWATGERLAYEALEREPGGEA